MHTVNSQFCNNYYIQNTHNFFKKYSGLETLAVSYLSSLKYNEEKAEYLKKRIEILKFTEKSFLDSINKVVALSFSPNKTAADEIRIQQWAITWQKSLIESTLMTLKDFKDLNNGFKVSFEEPNNFTLTINKFTHLDKINAILNLLPNISIFFTPLSIDMFSIELFIKNRGLKIQHIDLRNLSLNTIDDAFINIITKYCLNLKSLCLCTYNSININNLNYLSKFESLDYTVFMNNLKDSDNISYLLKIFPSIKISFTSEDNVDVSSLKKFIECHGANIEDLDLRKLKHTIDEAFLKVISKKCLNLKSLRIKSRTITNSDNLNRLLKLETLDLSSCENLLSINLSSLKVLKDINLSNCYGLRNLNLSYLSTLKNLNLKNCTRLESQFFRQLSLLENIDCTRCIKLKDCNFDQLPKLEVLNFSDCEKLKTVDSSQFKNLKTLYLQGCALEAFDFTHLIELQMLDLSGWKTLKTIDLSPLINLTSLEMQFCSKLVDITLGSQINLASLDLSKCAALTSLNLSQLVNMEYLNLEGCKALESLDLSKSKELKYLNVSNCKVTTLDLSHLLNLTELHLDNCEELKILNLDSPLKLTDVQFNGCKSLTTLNLSQLSLLSDLNLNNCSELTTLILSPFSKLKNLSVKSCNKLHPLNFDQLPFLQFVELTFSKEFGCFDLNQLSTELQGLSLEGWETLNFDLKKYHKLKRLTLLNCGKMLKLESNKLEVLELSNCEKVPILKLPNLTTLNISNFQRLKQVDFKYISKLQKFNILNCPNLRIFYLDTLSNLTLINISECKNITHIKLSQLTNLKSIRLMDQNELISFDLKDLPLLEELYVFRCNKLINIDVSQLSSLNKLDFSGCSALSNLVLGNIKKLTTLKLTGCTELSINSQFLSFFQQRIESTQSSKAWFWCNYVINNQTLLKLHDDHPLLQKAIEVYIQANPNYINNPKNPFSIYKQLKKILEKEEKIPISFKLTSENINGQDIHLNFLSLQKDAIFKVFTAYDLPSGISLQTLKDLFTNFEKRLARLSLDDRNIVEKQIIENYEYPLENLKSKILKMDFIPNLLTLPDDRSSSIDAITVYLCTILQVIVNKRSEILDQEVFSPQEEMLLAFACSINSCSVGQKDGIIIFYNLLKLQDKFFNGQIERKVEDKIKNYFKASYQTLLNQAFADVKLITSLTGQMHEPQTAHQTLYLKNRFHKTLGLYHKLKFDPYTQYINDTLFEKVNKQPEEVAAEISTYVSPKKLCELIKREIDHFCENQNLFYMELYTYLAQIHKTSGEKTNLEDWLQTHLDIVKRDDDEFEFKGISTMGILAILKDMKYIEIEDPLDRQANRKRTLDDEFIDERKTKKFKKES